MEKNSEKKKVPKARTDVKVGEFIWAEMLIPKGLVKDGVLGGSKTSRDIEKGKKVKKEGMVVELKPHCLVVWYGTTFHGKTLEGVVVEPAKWEKDPRGKGWLYKSPIEVDAEVVEVLEPLKHEDETGLPKLDRSNQGEGSEVM